MPHKLHVIQGDITQFKGDAIVNAANTELLTGAGVCGAIHQAAGPKLLTECLTLGGCQTGEAKITKGYQLPAKYVIHTVGPVWHGGSRHEAELLAACYRNALELASQHDLKTIAFPAISCGIFGYPLEKAAAIAVSECHDFINTHPNINAIYFFCFDSLTFEIYKKNLTQS